VRSVSTGRDRHEGFLEAMAALGLEVDPALVVDGSAYSEKEGARCCRALLEGGERFTAVFAGNDLMALGCIDALTDAGRACPADVSVVGVNDMDWSARFSPPLTTVRLPHYELGRSAAELLLERLDDPAAASRRIVLPTELVVRGSTAPPRADLRKTA